MEIRTLLEKSHATAIEKGWWDSCVDKGSNVIPECAAGEVPEKLLMAHSEISEAVEIYRNPERSLTEIWHRADGKPEGFCVELADVFIRLADLIKALQLENIFESALHEKGEFNKTRPYRHGHKRA